MQFFDEMNSKYGFGDGAAVPTEAAMCRTVYVRVFNKLLERFGSEVRIMPFDRGGVHNWCLWVRVPLEYYNRKLSELVEASKHRPDHSYRLEELNAQDFDLEEPSIDDGWDKAYEFADQLDIDGCVETKVVLDKEHFDEILLLAEM